MSQRERQGIEFIVPCKKMTLAEIGGSTGGITTSAFSRNTARLADKLEKELSLRQVFEKLKCGWGAIFQ